MIILLSPSKTMTNETLLQQVYQDVLFTDDAHEVIGAWLAEISQSDLKKFYRVSAANAQRIEQDIRNFPNANCYEAIRYFDGTVYRHLDINSLNDDGQHYLHKHLRIFSGLYGLLRPADGIRRYRLDWGDPLKINGQSLGEYWAPRLASYLGDQLILNLASREYIQPLQKYLPAIHDVIFYEEDTHGARKQTSTPVKMARGALAHLMARHQALTLDEMRALSPEGFVCRVDECTPSRTVFLRRKS